MSMSRRTFLKMILTPALGVGVSSVGGVFYSTQVEPFSVETEELDISLHNLPAAFDGFTLVQISDIHMGGWMTAQHMASIAEKVNALEPDLIVITGDFVLNSTPRTLRELRDSLLLLRAVHGVIGIVGNHDYWSSFNRVTQVLYASNIHLLLNWHTSIRRGEESLYIAGVDDIWMEQQDLNAALWGIPEGACTILLAHEPDYADTVAADGRVNLQLSGHSHGGQVRLPLIGAPVLPYLGRKYDQGHYTLQNLQLYVNRGVGMIGPNVRFNCPPEITKITLRRH